MIGHLILTEIDAAQPAPFSYRIVTELLRRSWAFREWSLPTGCR